jgi:hypothetical protein
VNLSRTALPLFFALAVTGCGGPIDDDDAFASDTEAVNAEDGKYDAPDAEVRVRATGMTVWIKPVATPEWRDGGTVWVLRGRASRNLTEVTTFISEDGFARAQVVSARKFEIILDGGHELNTALSGYRFYANLAAEGGKQFGMTFFLAPRFARPSGSSKLYVYSTVRPVQVGQDLVYRGRVKGPAGTLSAYTDDDSDPTVSERSAGVWNVDFDFSRLALAADPPTDPVYFRLESGGQTYQKQAGLDVRLTHVGLTTKAPDVVWPTDHACKPATQACLEALPAGVTDTESCGLYRDVSLCDLPWVLPGLGASPDDNRALTQAVAAANRALPDNQTVAFESFWVAGQTDAAPAFARVIDAFVAHARLEDDFVRRGVIPHGQLDAALAAYQASGVLPAAKTTVYSDVFEVALLDQERLVAPGASQWTSKYLLYFPEAYRLVVLTLTTVEN